MVAPGTFYEGPIEDPVDEPVEDPVETPEIDPVEDPVEPVEDPAEVETPAVEIPEDFAEWMAGKDPAAVRKTFERFTNELEGVKQMERDLAPLAELRENLQSDPGLVRAIEDYYTKGEGAPSSDDKLKVLESRFEQFQQQTATERELERLHTSVELPFEDVELLRFAAENRIGSLEAAYKVMKHDDLVAHELKKQTDAIRANATAKVEVRPKAAPAPTTLKLEDLQNMSDAEFLSAISKK